MAAAFLPVVSWGWAGWLCRGGGVTAFDMMLLPWLGRASLAWSLRHR